MGGSSVRNLLALLGSVLLAVVVGCGEGSKEVTMPDNIQPPPEAGSVGIAAPSNATPSPGAPVKVAK
jgi:hypothetical protein